MAEIGDWFNQMPPVTRYWFAGSLGLPILCRFSLFSPNSMVLTSDFLKNLQLWKPLTAVLYYPLTGNQGFHFLMNLYFIYNYSQRLELGYFGGRTADYVFMLLFNWLALVGIGWALGMIMLMDPMVMSVIYVYCMINQDQIVSFWFGTRFKARYLPWALFGVNFMLGGGGISELVGILVGHLYYFVMMKYPADQGVTLLQTPSILYNYFPNDRPTPFVPPNRPTRPVPSAPAAPTSTPTSYNWGRGRRLED
uniref:Derlin n=1 Tax=Aceria tosichella TaxID=561515 RepID=A0A6G1SAG7_9ACAR